MANLTFTSNRTRIWRSNDVPLGASPIDPTACDTTGVHRGYLTKRIVIKAGITNQNNIRVHDGSGSDVHFFMLDAAQEIELWVGYSRLVQISADAAGQEVYVYMELQEGTPSA